MMMTIILCLRRLVCTTDFSLLPLFCLLIMSSSTVSSFAGRGSTEKSSWPAMQMPPEALLSISEQQQQTANEWVFGAFNYVIPSTTTMFTRRDLEGTDTEFEGATFVASPMQVWNARLLKKTVDRNGFELVEDSPVDSQLNFLDYSQVVNKYYPHCEALLKDKLGPGVAVVKAFDHNIRSNQGFGRELQNTNAKVQGPGGMVHADYTRVSAPRRLQQLSEAPKANDVLQQAESVLDRQLVEDALEGKRRYLLVNVWRNISPVPVQQAPLACIDASTVAFEDLRTFQIHYKDRVGENYFCCPSDAHQWCYYPSMTRDEALLLKQWDSEGGVAQGQSIDDKVSSFTVHSAFLDPTASSNAPPRESIETRCVVIWDAV